MGAVAAVAAVAGWLAGWLAAQRYVGRSASEQAPMPPGEVGGADTPAAAVLSAHSRRLRSAAEQLRRKEAAARLRLEDATSGIGLSPLLDQYATEAKCRTPAKSANSIVGQCHQMHFDDIRLALKRLRAYNRLGQAATTLSGKEISPAVRQIEGTTISDAFNANIKRLDSGRIALPHWAMPVDRAKLGKQLQKAQTTAAKAVEQCVLAQAELERVKHAQIAEKCQDAMSSKAPVTQWWGERLILENAAEVSAVRLNVPRGSQGSSARLGLGLVFGNTLGRATIKRVQPGSWASNQPGLIPGLVLVQLQGYILGNQSYIRAKELLENLSDTETIAMVFRDITSPTLLSPPPNVELCLKIRGVKSSKRHKSVQGWRRSSEGLTTGAY